MWLSSSFPYEGFAIPTGGTGWKVSDVKRTPEDTKPATEIRKKRHGHLYDDAG